MNEGVIEEVGSPLQGTEERERFEQALLPHLDAAYNLARSSSARPARPEAARGEECVLCPGRRTLPTTLTDINHPTRPTLTLNQACKLLQLAVIEVGNGPEGHPRMRKSVHVITFSCHPSGRRFGAG